MLKIARDDFQQAEQIIVEAQLGLDKETSTIMFVAPYLMAKATLRMAQSRAEEALEVAQEVAEKARQSGMHHFLPEALLIQGQAFGAMDKLNQAGDVLQDARSVATEIGQRRVLWQILAALAEFEERQGNSSKARTYRHEARKVIDTIAEHCGSQLRPSFLSMPAVQAVLQVSGTSEVPGS